MEYKYEALDAQGNEVKDTIKAYDHKAAITAIRNKGLFPTIVRVIGSGVEPLKKSKINYNYYRNPRWLIPKTNMEKAMVCIICVLIILIAGLVKEILIKDDNILKRAVNDNQDSKSN